MVTEPLQDSSPLFSIPEAATRLAVEEPVIREWLSTFDWERHYDVSGNVYLGQQDFEFLQVIKSLKAIDNTCESLVRLIDDDGPQDQPEPDAAEPPADEPVEAEAEADPDPVETNMAEIETLKAELRELHAKPTKKPFWKFW